METVKDCICELYKDFDLPVDSPCSAIYFYMYENSIFNIFDFGRIVSEKKELVEDEIVGEVLP